jgi:hypothetical protein
MRLGRFLILALTTLAGVDLVNSMPVEPLPARLSPIHSGGKQKLIEFGWDMPTPRKFRRHLNRVERRPFDGTVLRLSAGRSPFGTIAIPEAQFTRDRAILARTSSTVLKDNFLLVWATPVDEDYDWFDDGHWAATQTTLRRMARTVTVGGLKGIALDPETYSWNLWSYRSQLRRNEHSFADYEAMVRIRGSQFMTALQQESPGSTVLTLGLMSWMNNLLYDTPSPQEIRSRLKDSDYGLWPAFVNGMLEALPSRVDLVDGHEYAYYLYRATSFDDAVHMIRNHAKLFVDQDVEGIYDQQVSIGHGVYLDGIMNLRRQVSGFGRCLSRRKNRLKMLQHNVYHAMRTANQYVWIYSENMDWWRSDVPEGVGRAIRVARTKHERGQPLNLTLRRIKSRIDQCMGQ